MPEISYLKCRNPIMTFIDPETRFKIPRGQIAKFEGSTSPTMQKWLRRGGLIKVSEELFLKQQKAQNKNEPFIANALESPVENQDQKNLEENPTTQPKALNPISPSEIKTKPANPTPEEKPKTKLKNPKNKNAGENK